MAKLSDLVAALPYTRGTWTAPHYTFSKRDVDLLNSTGNPTPRLLRNDGAMSVIARRKGDDELNARVCMVDLRADCKRSERHSAPCPERDANARVIAAAPLLLEVAAAAHDKLCQMAKELEEGERWNQVEPGTPSNGARYLAGELAAIAGRLSGAIMPAVTGDATEYGDSNIVHSEGGNHG